MLLMNPNDIQRHAGPAGRGRAPLLAGTYERLLLGWLGRARRGLLAVTGPDGRQHEFGGSLPGPRAEWLVHDWRVAALVARRGDVGLAEAYMEDMWDSPCVEDFYRWLIANLDELRTGDGSGIHRLLGILRDPAAAPQLAARQPKERHRPLRPRQRVLRAVPRSRHDLLERAVRPRGPQPRTGAAGQVTTACSTCCRTTKACWR